MNWSRIFTVYCKELRDSLRDRRTVISMIVVPTVVMPLLIFGMGKEAGKASVIINAQSWLISAAPF